MRHVLRGKMKRIRFGRSAYVYYFDTKLDQEDVKVVVTLIHKELKKFERLIYVVTSSDQYSIIEWSLLKDSVMDAGAFLFPLGGSTIDMFVENLKKR